jgi:hypothetical protein
MSVEEFYEWGHKHNYPLLMLGNGDLLSPGPYSWYSLLTDTQERLDRAIARVELWQRRLEQERGV